MTRILLVLLLPVITAAQDHVHPADGAKTEKPLIFLDKSPRIVAYQLNRLSNDQLLLVERAASDPKYIPVYQAILTRPGLSAKYRQESVSALALLNGTVPTVELLKALQDLNEERPAVREELSRMLLSQEPGVLARSLEALRQAASSEGPASVRAAAFAALVAIQQPGELWEYAAQQPEGLAHLIEGISLAPQGPLRAAFAERTLPLLREDVEDPLRLAAINAAARMPESETAVFEALSALIQNGLDVPACSRALSSLPKNKWPSVDLQPLADSLLKAAEAFPPSERLMDDFLHIAQFGNDLAAKLPREQGIQLRRALRNLSVHVVRLRTLYELMFYDKTLLVVEAGKPVELILENPDAMQHNWVLVEPGAAEEIGRTADQMTPEPDSQGRAFIPRSTKILAATKLLNSGETARLRFTAPEKPGEYPYLCTFPGHWQRMRGVLLVVPDLDAYYAQANPEPEEATMTEWKVADLTPILDRLNQPRNLQKGQELFTNLGCVACHQIGQEGYPYGPELTGLFAKYQHDAAAVLTEIIEPSKNMDPRFQAREIHQADGNSFTGILVKEDEEHYFIQIGPGEAAIQKYPKKSIVSLDPQPQSLMPAGLLNLLNQEQILDLLAFLKSGGASQQAAAQP